MAAASEPTHGTHLANCIPPMSRVFQGPLAADLSTRVQAAVTCQPAGRVVNVKIKPANDLPAADHISRDRIDDILR